MIELTGLNDNQKDAVLADDPYLRIVAGAGSGKTRVLTMRVAHLIQDEQVPAGKVQAITFTNKAANDMKDRIRRMLPQETAAPWISTKTAAIAARPPARAKRSSPSARIAAGTGGITASPLVRAVR